jgi:GAF domain-containing protein
MAALPRCGQLACADRTYGSCGQSDWRCLLSAVEDELPPTRAARALTSPADELRALRDENRTLYGVIKLVSSSLELGPMLQGIVDLATDATDCHACFIYLLEDDRLTIRAASPVFADAVGRVQFAIEEGLTGWVARHRTPEFIREGAMDDPRMKYIPLLEEERFQSMVAVPILARSDNTIGVIVLHTKAPREFTEDTLRLLVHIASLVSGAIENAQLYDQERRRVDALTRLSGLGQEVAAATDAADLGVVVARGARRLLEAEVCQIYRLDRDGSGVVLLASDPPAVSTPPVLSVAGLALDALEDRGGRAPARTLWSELEVGDQLVTALTAGGERLGLLCVGSPPRRTFTDEDTELARAIAHLAAIAIKRAELIEHLTNANIVKDMFEALAAGATSFAVAKAAEVRCDLTGPYLMVCAEPAGGREQSSGEWRAAAEVIGAGLSGLSPRAAIEAGPGPVRAALPLGSKAPQRVEEFLRLCRELGKETGAAIGVSERRHTPAEATRAYREALDATTIGRALLGEGGAIAYAELGAYRYLVRIAADEAPRDRMRAAVDELIAYDTRRRTALLDTLERYLAERRSVIESARALFIHPNTLRQRLARIEELTGVELDNDDLLSLELAIKLARLHGRPKGE